MTASDSLRPEACVDALLPALQPYDPFVPGLLAYLRERKKFWSARTWRVGLMGVTSAGKSTIINGFFGSPILPARVKPSSNVLILTRRGTGPRAVIHYSDGRQPEEVREHLPRRLAAVGDEHHNPHNRLNVQEIEVFGPSFQVQQDAVVVDTPGLNAYSYDLHETLTLRTFLPTVDLVVFVITAKANSDAQVEKYLRDISLAGKPVILVQNMIDTVEPKLGLGGVVVRTRQEVALDLKRRAQRIAKAALGVDDVPVHQVAAVRAVEGDLPRSGIGELARAIERELARQAPVLHAGRLGQLRAELMRNLPADSAREETAALETEASALQTHARSIADLHRWLRGEMRPKEQELRATGERLASVARRLDKHDVDSARKLKEKLARWSEKSARVLHEFAGAMVERIAIVAKSVGLADEDYQVEPPRGRETRAIRVHAWDASWVEKRKRSGFWAGVWRTIGTGGYDEITHHREAMDRDTFVRDVDAAVKGAQEWFDEHLKRLATIGERHAETLSAEVRRREEALEARRAVVSTQQARRKLRGTLREWIERLDTQIAAASRELSEAGARTSCAPIDELAVVEVARPALHLLALGDLVARHRFIAARDALLSRTRQAPATSLLVGWDRDALEGFLARFWFDRVQGSLDTPCAAVKLPTTPPYLLVVDESRVDFDYSNRLGREVAETVLFLVLDVEQPGATESTLSRERHLLDVRFGAMCLVLQSLRAFRRAEGWAADDLVEALLEAHRIIHRWSVKPLGVLANDDEIGLTLLADRLLAGPDIRTLADEQQLVAELDGLMDTTLSARIVRRWREVRHGTTVSRRTN
jgi:predicted GTPase